MNSPLAFAPPDVTVVVCTYNRATLLAEALRSLTALETDGRFRYEVLVVDNASTDDTPRAIAAARDGSPVPIRDVRETRQGVAHARNRGVRDSRGKWIAFFDDDQIADPAWLKNLLAMAERKNVRVVGGAVRLKVRRQTAESPPNASEPGAGVPSVYERQLLQSGRGDAPYCYTRRRAPGTGNLLIARAVFDKVGLFDVHLREASEDTELFGRVQAGGFEAWFTPDAVVFHWVPAYRLSPRYLEWRAQRQGWGRVRDDFARGRLRGAFRAVSRVLQAGLVHWPALWLAKWRGNDEALERRCRLWSVQGYVRGLLRTFAPRWFPQDEFYARIDFRSERVLFAE